MTGKQILSGRKAAYLRQRNPVLVRIFCYEGLNLLLHYCIIITNRYSHKPVPSLLEYRNNTV